MLLSTDERLEQLSKVTRQSFKTGVKREQIDFKITPPVVVFQSFMPGKQYNTTLTLCNTSKVSVIVFMIVICLEKVKYFFMFSELCSW